MTIKHLVLCGGGAIAFPMFASLQYLHNINYWNIDNIETIYSCSIGSFIGVLISLKLDMEWIYDFLIKRPWDNIFNLKSINYLKIITNKGIYSEDIWKIVLKPVFKAKNIDIDITLLEHYKLTNIEINFYSTEINNTLIKKTINYKNNPNMKVIKAIYTTSCIPVIFVPSIIDNKYNIDGGILNNNPLNDCYYYNNCSKDEILQYKNVTDINNNFDFGDNENNDNNGNKYIIDICNNINIEKDEKIGNNLLSFLIFIIKKLVYKLGEISSVNDINIDNSINISLFNSSNILGWFKILNDYNHRLKAYNIGIEITKKYLLNNTKIVDISNNIISDISLSDNIISDISLSNNIISDISLSNSVISG